MYPDKKRFTEDSKKFSLIPISEEIFTDFETPISIFSKLNGGILLESVESGENVGRYSIIGIGEIARIELNGKIIKILEYRNDKQDQEFRYEIENPLEKIREYLKEFNTPDYEHLPPFFGGIIGYLGYETVSYFEKIDVKKNNGSIPDGILVIPKILLVYDSVKRSVIVIYAAIPNGSPQKEYQVATTEINKIISRLRKPTELKEISEETTASNRIEYKINKSRFTEWVNKSIEYIHNGEIIQVVLSHEISLLTTEDPIHIYRKLRIGNPSPYMFYLDFGGFQIVGSSPEVMVKLEGEEILLKPIAGTRIRGRNVAEDSRLEDELISNEKERAEHLMLVDLARNDLGRVAVPGSVEVKDYMRIEKYSRVMHIVSTIKARLDDNFDVFDLIRAVFPAGTVTGAPKIRAMQIISELEQERRGPYAGMIMYLGFNGNFDSCITIRTMVIKDDVCSIRAGAGIVADSDPAAEYEETLNKARALIEVCNIKEEGAVR